MASFSFSDQLKVGNGGERFFCEMYSSLAPTKAEDRSYDFLLGNGDTVELKTDTYNMDETPNFFMEQWSDGATAKIGGPWRAQNDGVKYFVYLFMANRTFYWFSPQTLCQKLDAWISENHPTLKNIRNRGWTTQGYIIPREAVMDVCEKVDVFPT